jgi:hypothetical protein
MNSQFFVLFFVGLGFELRASCLNVGALLLESHLQSILLWLFGGLLNQLSGWPRTMIPRS